MIMPLDLNHCHTIYSFSITDRFDCPISYSFIVSFIIQLSSYQYFTIPSIAVTILIFWSLRHSYLHFYCAHLEIISSLLYVSVARHWMLLFFMICSPTNDLSISDLNCSIMAAILSILLWFCHCLTFYHS